MKITKNQLKELIKEEAQKIKVELELQDRKVSILNEIKEMYGDMEEGEIDELFGGLFKKETPEEKRKKLSDEIINMSQKRQSEYRAKTGKTIPMPKWAQPGTPEHEKAINAAMELGTSDIYFNPTKNQFLQRQYAAKGHGFGSGESGTLEESKKEAPKVAKPQSKPEEKK